MDWENVSLATVGFGLYCLALILKSTSLRHLRFARMVDLAQINNVAPRYRGWLQHGALALSLVLMGAALWQTINTDRSTFRLLSSLAGMLIAVRLLGFFFTRVSLIVIEIETDPASKLSFSHLRRSPFILGGLALLTVALSTPVALDGLLRLKFDSFRQQEWRVLQATVKSEDFTQHYIPRSLQMKGQAQYETEFFSRALLPGRRVIVQGRAGVGKSWFLNQLRSWFHEHHPDIDVISLNATDLKPGDDLIGHVSHKIFGGLAWGARPYAGRIMAGALILVDGLDEVHSLNRDEVVRAVMRMALDPANGRSTVVVTTRPTGLQQLTQTGFEVAVLPELMAKESDKVLRSPDRMAKLAVKLGVRLAQGHVVDVQALRLFSTTKVPDGARLTPDQTQRLFREFVDGFGFSVRSTARNSDAARMPFLGTYRDIDIIEELFLRTLAVKAAAPTQTRARKRASLIGQFVLRRIELNYHAAAGDPAYAQRVVEALVQECADYLRESPQATTLHFDRRRFEHAFDGTTFDKVVLESELLTEQPGSRHLGFDNPVLDEYFLTRARRP